MKKLLVLLLLFPLALFSQTKIVLKGTQVTISSLANIAGSSVVANATGSPATPTAVLLGVGLTFSNGKLCIDTLNFKDTIYALNGLQILGVGYNRIGLGGFLSQNTTISGSNLYAFTLDSMQAATGRGFRVNFGSDAGWDIPVRDSATGFWTRVGKGTVGQVLTMLGAGGIGWGAGGGSVGVQAFLNPLDAPFNAVGNNIANDNTAVQNCINAASAQGKGVILTALHKVTGLTVPSGMIIIGLNDSTTGFHTATNGPCIQVLGSNVDLERFVIYGDSTGGSSSTQRGIQVDGTGAKLTEKYNIVINNVRFHGLNTGFYGVNNGFNEGGVRVLNNFFDSCSQGIFLDVQSEYGQFVNNRISTCGVGFRNRGGNNSMVGGLIENSSYYGVWIDGGFTNDAHSKMVGVTVNSAVVYCFYITSVTSNGYEFDACTSMGTPAAPIQITGSNSIKFQDCFFRSQSAITVTSSANISFVTNTFSTTPTLSYTAGQVSFVLNNWIAGAPTGIDGFYLDYANQKIGLGAAPAINGFDLNIIKTATTQVRVINTGGNGAYAQIATSNGTNGMSMGTTGASTTTSGMFVLGENYISSTGPINMGAGSNPIKLWSRFEIAKGATVASATNVTLGTDGNVFHISGTTTINNILATNWQAGSTIKLIFDGSLTFKNNTSGGGGAVMLLAGGIDFSATANDVITLLYDGTSWFEQSRSVN